MAVIDWHATKLNKISILQPEQNFRHNISEPQIIFTGGKM